MAASIQGFRARTAMGLFEAKRLGTDKKVVGARLYFA